MITSDYTALDRPEISMNSFYPRPGWTPTPEGAEDYSILAEEGISLSGRFFLAGAAAPTILFFYGNGETAVDYDGIAPLYNRIGVNFFVVDYRGYGGSGGSPTFSTTVSDAHVALATIKSTLAKRQFTGPIFVMGRSMGRHPAFELAANAPDQIDGLIIESGRPTLGQFLHGLEESQGKSMEDDYQAKVASIGVPVLVIHGEVDTLAPLQQAVSMFDSFASTEKRMIVVPGAGHNDLLYRGLDEYFGAIHNFVFQADSARSDDQNGSK